MKLSGEFATNRQRGGGCRNLEDQDGGPGDDYLAIGWNTSSTSLQPQPGYTIVAQCQDWVVDRSDSSGWLRLPFNAEHRRDAPTAVNVAFGEGGNDVLYGSRGTDILDGGTEDDRLYGRSGDDHVRSAGRIVRTATPYFPCTVRDRVARAPALRGVPQ